MRCGVIARKNQTVQMFQSCGHGAQHAAPYKGARRRSRRAVPYKPKLRRWPMTKGGCRVAMDLLALNLFSLTRAMVDIESVTENEKKVGDFGFGYPSEMAGRTNGKAERIAVAPGRDNVFASWGEPV